MKTLTDLGREARGASMDAHGELVNPEMAFDFMRQVYIDEHFEDDEEAELFAHESAPIEFIAAYYDACRDQVAQ